MSKKIEIIFIIVVFVVGVFLLSYLIKNNRDNNIAINNQPTHAKDLAQVVAKLSTTTEVDVSGDGHKKVVSPDKKFEAISKDDKNMVSDPVDPINYNEIWLKDVVTGKESLLVKSGKTKSLNIKNISASNFPFDEIRNLNIDDFSIDGNLLYFRSAAWTTSAAVFSVNVKTKEIRFVTDSNYLEVIKSGKYKGMLITLPHRYYSDKEGSYDYYYITDPKTGKDIIELGESKNRK